MSYIGSTPTTQSFIAGTDSFNGTGSATNFTLSRFVNSVNDVQVVVNNVVQYPPNYSVSGNTLTISPAPSSGTNNVYVRYLSTTLQSIAPSQGSSIQFGTGSVGLPSISFIGDTNTGIYSPAADTIAFVEGGVEAMRIDSSANVVIGTSSASARLQVHLNSADFVTAKISNSVTGTGVLDGFDLVVGTSGEAYIYNRENQPIIFGTNNTERARIDSSGNLLVGRTNSSASAAVNGCIIYGSGAADFGQMVFSRGANTVYVSFRNASSGAEVGNIQTNGTNTSYVTSSDYRLKENIQPMQNALSKVAALKPCTYTWTADGSDGEGFIAHELQAVVPDAVVGEKDAVNEDGSIKPQGIDTSFLVATLTAAIQEQQAMIDTMKQEIAELKAKVGE